MALRWLSLFLCASLLALPAHLSAPVSALPSNPGPLAISQPATPDRDAAQSTDSTLSGYYGFPPGVNPLTGLPVADPTLLQRRPVLVKVSNYPPSVRPQAGLSLADMVFEYYIGEGANRFLALYYGQDTPKAGSLRSGRLVDGPLTRLYQGLLVYGSADPRVDKVLQSELGERAISNLEAPCPSVCGDDTHASPWVFANTAQISDFARRHAIPDDAPSLYGTLFDSTPPQSDQFAVRVGVEYASFDRGEWRYDPQSELYLRWVEHNLNKEDMVPLTDQLSGQQLAFANVILLYATYIQYNETLHDIEIWENDQGQPAVFFRDGLMISGSWQVKSHDQPIQFYNEWGLPMALKPGNSWIVIAGSNSTLSQSAPGVWEMHFNQP